MFGYADESGEPGVKKNEHDYFVFCIILFDSKDSIIKYSKKISEFRHKHNLADNHEFHFSTDSKRIRAEFTAFIKTMSFDFISVSIKKDNNRRTASFAKLSKLILELLENKHINASILMDTNPNLYNELRKNKKSYSVLLHFAERKSQSNDFIQVADYVTAIRARLLKYPSKKSVMDAYSKIHNKLIGSIDV